MKMITVFLLLCMLLVVACTSSVESEVPVVPAMDRATAIQIATISECTQEGILTNDAFYNEITKTWWIDLILEKEGCNPACVVSENKTAEINWRCTGLIVP